MSDGHGDPIELKTAVTRAMRDDFGLSNAHTTYCSKIPMRPGNNTASCNVLGPGGVYVISVALRDSLGRIDIQEPVLMTGMPSTTS